MTIAPDHIDVIASDVAKSVAFYRRLGVQIPDEAVWHDGGAAHHVQFEMPSGFQLGIDSRALTRGYDAGFADDKLYIVFTVPTRDAVDELYAEVTGSGHPGRTAPFDAFWGARYAMVRDPDGNAVGIMSPSDPDRHGPPPEGL